MAAAFVLLLAQRLIDKDALPRFNRGSKEMVGTIEVLAPDQLKVHLVDRCGCVEKMARDFGRHLRDDKFPQFVVNVRKQVNSGLTVAGNNYVEGASHVGHVYECNRSITVSNSKTSKLFNHNTLF